MQSKISVIFFLFTVFIYAEDPLRVISSDFNSIILEFTPVYFKTTEEIINNQKYLNVGFDYGFIGTNYGEPAIPEYGFNVGVPSETGNTIEILNTVYSEIEGMIVPVSIPVKDNNIYSYKYEVNENYFNYKSPEDPAVFGDFGIIRDIKTQTIRILPVKFDPAAGKIRLYSKIILKINFAPSILNPDAEKDDFAAGSLINYDIARQWKEKSKSVLKISAPENSVLANGNWVRFETTQEGFYKITRSMLNSYGIDASSVDPRTIKIYNNGGKMLPENPELPRPLDLVENAIQVFGEEDGSFDEGDYILFYGRGNSFWDYDTTSQSIKRYFHLYSKANYYWITSGGSNGKRVQNKAGLNTTPGYVQTSTQAFADWDVDKVNLGQTGRYFAGDAFSQSFPSRTYMNKLDFRVNGTPVNYNFRLINSSLESSSIQFRVSENSIPINTLSIGGISDRYAGIAVERTVSFNDPLPDNRSVLKFEITQPSLLSSGYLDYFELRYQKELKPTDNYLLFFSWDTSAIIEFRLSNFPSTNIKVFDVTDNANIKNIIPMTGWPSGGEFRFQVSETEGYVSKYLAVGNDDFKTPSNPVAMPNSNVRGITEGAGFIIITHKNFIEAANRLKSYRENETRIPVSTIVIDVDEIFNEFSGGLLDVSGIRDFIKYAYDNWNIKPEYVLFFGAGTYDYKNIEEYGQNFIPTWQTSESLDLWFSYTSDDYYVNLNANDSKIDLSPGRITVRTLAEAIDFVNKIIEYENNSDLGMWRNLITLVADDAFTSTHYEGNLHTPQCESYFNTLPDYLDFNKIYMVKYPVVFTGSGKRMPEVNRKIIEAMNNGSMIVNYVGHGNPELWAHEVVFDRNSSIPQINNPGKYFFLITATCSFGYFDIPNFRSASEDLVYLRNNGSIGALTTSRVVFSGDNAALNRTFYNILYNSPRDSTGYPMNLGKAVALTKNSGTAGDLRNIQKYFLFGDPTMRLNIPLYPASIDTINGQPTLQTNIQLKALGKAALNGEVKRTDNTFWEDFNGEGILNVYDSERRERYQYGVNSRDTSSFTAPGGVIFRGRISVSNGKFNGEFVVPKDISYENKKGKIVFYFYSNDEDGLGFTDNIIVGGTDSTTVNDGNGPKIDIYFDDPSYTGSYLINPDSRLIVKLFDETGINTTGTGVGHRLEGILNDNEANPIDFSGAFTGDLDAGGKSGEINYSFDDLETGDYKLDVKAWDVFNNFSKETAYFSVVTGNDLVIRDVYNYPNPFGSNTTFTFQQNLNSALNVEVRVYTIAGRLIKVIKEDNVNERFVTISWDGRDDDGSLLSNGTYLYKLKVVTTDGQFSKSLLGKLAVIR